MKLCQLLISLNLYHLHKKLDEDSMSSEEKLDSQNTHPELMLHEVLRRGKRSLFPTSQHHLLHLKQLSILAFYAIISTLARRGLTLLTVYQGSYVGGIIWPNFTSCLIIGMLSQSMTMWDCFSRPREMEIDSEGGTSKPEIKLYVGLTTGFCGGLSSFSSMILETFLKSADLEAGPSHDYPNVGGYGIMQFCSVLITQICVSVAAFHLGKHLVQVKDFKVKGLEMIEDLSVVAGVLSWVAVIALIAIKEWRIWTFGCIVSPIGCFLRYYLSRKLNHKHGYFPLGTFAANVLGSAVISALVLIDRGNTPHGRVISTALACQMVQGLIDGFCGSLTTVSTFVLEMCNMRSFRSYIYGGASIAISYCIMVIILGSYSWTRGLSDPIC